MKKILRSVLLSALLLLGNASFLNQDIEATNEVVNKIGNNIETVYADYGIGLYKYEINEGDVTYEVIVDTQKDLLIIDNRTLTLEQFNQMIKKQKQDATLETIDLVEQYSVDLKKVDEYEKIHKSYQLVIDNHIHPLQTRCMFCPLGTTEVPKTNYESKERYFGNKTNSFEIEATEICIVAIAAFATWGMVPLAEKIVLAIIDTVAVVTKPVEIAFDQYQSYHNVCDLAIKERRYITATSNEIQKPINQNYTNYFYSGKPY